MFFEHTPSSKCGGWCSFPAKPPHWTAAECRLCALRVSGSAYKRSAEDAELGVDGEAGVEGQDGEAGQGAGDVDVDGQAGDGDGVVVVGSDGALAEGDPAGAGEALADEVVPETEALVVPRLGKRVRV